MPNVPIPLLITITWALATLVVLTTHARLLRQTGPITTRQARVTYASVIAYAGLPIALLVSWPA